MNARGEEQDTSARVDASGITVSSVGSQGSGGDHGPGMGQGSAPPTPGQEGVTEAAPAESRSEAAP